MDSFKRVCRLGTGLTYEGARHNASYFVAIDWDGKRLSLSGVIGPRNSGNCTGSCGQIVGHLHLVQNFAPGWGFGRVRELAAIWRRWHLNDLRPGSPVQMDFLRANPVSVTYPESHYERALQVLTEAGLNPDAYGYRYGSAWHCESVPDEVLQWLHDLPPSDRPCPDMYGGDGQ